MLKETGATRAVGPRVARGKRSQNPARSCKGGRKPVQPPKPSVVYTDDLAATICEHIADGLSLKEVGNLAGMPSRATAYRWLTEHAAFATMYARARDERADLIADEIVTIADNDSDPARARVRIDARKWWAAKVNPRKYGEKITTENVNTNYTISDKPLTEEEFEATYCTGAAPGFSTH